MFDQAGNLYACQGGDRQVAKIDVAKGKAITVVAKSHDGKKLNSPNDLALDGHGGLYFTDPRYGGGEPVEQKVMGVYYIDRSGKVSRVIEDLERPNGILVSPDGRHLYVAEPNRRELYRYDIDSPGKLSGKKLIFTGDRTLDGGGPDGMAHDTQGNVYATYNGIVVLAPDGKLIGRISVPERPANCAFGGKDNKTLYITARTSLYAIDTKVKGMELEKRGP
jgi:gluconolactonase